MVAIGQQALAVHPDTGFLVFGLGFGVAMLAFGLIELVNSRRFAPAIRHNDWVLHTVHGTDAAGNLLVGDASGPASAVVRLHWLTDSGRARFRSASNVWIAAPARGAGVIAIDGSRDLAQCWRSPTTVDASQLAAETQDSSRTIPLPDAGTAPEDERGARASTAIAPDDTSNWRLRTRGDPAVPPDKVRAEPESPTRRARLLARGSGRGRWLIAAMGLTVVGLTAWFVLAHPFGGSRTGHASVASATGHSSTGSGTEDPYARLRPGQCLNYLSARGPYFSSTAKFAVVPCRQPHDAEAYYRYTMSGGFPGDFSIQDDAMPNCGTRLAGYIGSGPSDRFTDVALTPDQSQWAAGEHVAVCVLAQSDGRRTTGSARQTR